MSSQKRPKRFIGTFRYSALLEPKTLEFTENMEGKVHFYDGKHVVRSNSYSDFSQLAKAIYMFWTDTVTDQLNLRRFSFWLSEFLDDFGITNINDSMLQEELKALNTGISLSHVGVPIKEAKVVYHEPVVEERKSTTISNYKSILKPTGKPIKEAKVVYHEPVVEERKEKAVVSSHVEVKTRKEIDYGLGESASDVRKRLKHVEHVKEAKVVPDFVPTESYNTPEKRKLQPVGSIPDYRQIEESSVPKDKEIKESPPENVLPLPSRKIVSKAKDNKVKPSDIDAPEQTRSPEVRTLPPIKKEKVKPSPPERTLLKPSEVLKSRETIFQKTPDFSDSFSESNPSDTLLKPSEYLKEKELANNVKQQEIRTLEKPSSGIKKGENKVKIKQETLLRPSEFLKKRQNFEEDAKSKQEEKTKTETSHKETKRDSQTLVLQKHSSDKLNSLPNPKKIVNKEIPTPKKSYQLTDVSGLGESKANLLYSAGIKSVEQLANSKVEELVKIKGIGESTALKYINNAKKLLKQ